MRQGAGRPRRRELQDMAEFKTTVPGLLVLRDWLKAHGVTHVAMEATGEYWKPVWRCSRTIRVLLVNARHVKQVPGPQDRRQRCGSGCASCRRPACCAPASCRPSRSATLRHLTRYRTRRSRAQARGERLHKALEDTGIKLDCVATDMLGKSRAARCSTRWSPARPTRRARRARRGQAAPKIPALREALEGRFEPLHALIVRDPRAPGLPRRADRASSRRRSRSRLPLSRARLSCCARSPASSSAPPR